MKALLETLVALDDVTKKNRCWKTTSPEHLPGRRRRRHRPRPLRGIPQVGAAMLAHGAEVCVRGGCRRLEGDWAPSRVVVLKFPDRDAAGAL
jgi:hypothetical protein